MSAWTQLDWKVCVIWDKQRSPSFDSEPYCTYNQFLEYINIKAIIFINKKHVFLVVLTCLKDFGAINAHRALSCRKEIALRHRSLDQNYVQ